MPKPPPFSTEIPIDRSPTVEDPGLSGDLAFVTLAAVVDVGLGGLGLQTEEALRVGHSYTVDLESSNLELTGKTVWNRQVGTFRQNNGRIVPRYRAGLAFESETITAHQEALQEYLILNAVSETASRRPSPRYHLRSDTPRVLHTRYPFTVDSISVSGMIVKVDQLPTPDAVLHLRLGLSDSEQLDLTARLSDVYQTYDNDRIDTRVALEFVNLYAGTRETLGNWVRERRSLTPLIQ